MRRLVVVGNGMAGVACVEHILKHNPEFQITIFGDETHVNYNRILLSLVLAGEKSADEIVLNDVEWYRSNNIRARLGAKISHIDRATRTVVDETGEATPYDKLILATGSSAFIPPIPGVDKENVHVFRTLDDTHALLAKARKGLKTVVIGGGLLGLEAARGLQVRGCEVTVIHLMDSLMERQLDATGGEYLKRRIESLGIRVMLPRQTAALFGNGHVDGLRFASGEEVDAELVVIAAGIKPNATLARSAGLEVNRGIVVNDFMETSDPDIFAVGECTEHRGQTFGLVAPLYDQARVLAATITENRGPVFSAAAPAAKLKIMGIDIFSAGSIDETEAGVEVLKYEDPALGAYKKLLLKSNRLHGMILVGDIEDEYTYMDWLRSGTDLSSMRRQLLFPPAAGDRGLEVADMPDSETICGCNGVRKGEIIHAIHEYGITTMRQLKDRTRASASCGTCAGLCEKLLRAVVPDFEVETKTTLCACVPFSYERLREIVRTQKLKSVEEVLAVYGNRKGCEVCKPALSYMLDMLWCGGHEEDRSARFINDRVHANIQKDGTFSVVPRMRGGITSPDELRRIADVADKYKVPMVKVTGSQRLDLLGVKKADLPNVWRDLGMPSGQAYSKGVRMVKTCVGTEFCRFGVQDSTNTGIELERRLENLFTPHKFKMGVVGCPRNCAEATVKDLGFVGQDGSWQVVVGGAAGKSVRKADLLVTVETTAQALEAGELFFQYYRENGNYLERSYDFVERLGIEKIRKETVYASDEEQKKLLDRLHRSKEYAQDAWLERDRPSNPTQFVQIEPMEMKPEVTEGQLV
ncbi:MAG TPA: nitrite reductase large subunit NirB [Bryobacteraceae bacterium]|nr:nitrite reductase large subunit NirB [Bryobacteraceae bacterium]